jgi:hypothetical protein
MFELVGLVTIKIRIVRGADSTKRDVYMGDGDDRIIARGMHWSHESTVTFILRQLGYEVSCQ